MLILLLGVCFLRFQESRNMTFCTKSKQNLFKKIIKYTMVRHVVVVVVVALQQGRRYKSHSNYTGAKRNKCQQLTRKLGLFYRGHENQASSTTDTRIRSVLQRTRESGLLYNGHEK